MKNLLNRRNIIFASLFLGVVFFSLLYFKDAKEAQGQNNVNAKNALSGVAVPTEIASSGDVGDLGSSNTSWPGQIISYSDSEITPSREGQIAQLYINIGSSVQADQVVGRMNRPPVSLELTSLLADKKQALIIAETQAAATKRFVAKSKKRLTELSKAIYQARDAALDVAVKEATQSSSTTTGASKDLDALKNSRDANINVASTQLSQAETTLPIKFNTMLAAAKALVQRSAGAISSSGTAPDTPSKASAFQFNQAYGSSNVTTRSDYLYTLSSLVTVISNANFTPETEVTNYTQATLKLLANTGVTEQVMASTVENIRNIVFEDEQIFFEALKEYKDAQKQVDVIRAKSSKITTDYDREIIGAQTNLSTNEAYLKTIESMKASQIAEADKEFAKERASLEAKIAELNRQLELAAAEVIAATEAYNLVEAGTGEEIRATQSGVISAIYKKVGDYVMVDTPVAATSSQNENHRFVRFRAPIDMELPTKGETVTIEQPGFPLNPKKAVITGVGLALDKDGSYQADAEFIEPIDWPVNLSVRVISSSKSSFVLIPFTAIWWDNREIPKIWIVDEEGSITSRTVALGRALGDRIEILEGLEDNEKYITVTSPDLREGVVIREANASSNSPPSPSQKEESKSGGHGDNEEH